MNYVEKKADGSYQLKKAETLVYFLDEKIPHKTKSFKSLVQEIDQKVRQQYPTIKQGALNNVHGDWYEWFINIASWIYFIEKDGKSHLPILLPNVNRLDVSTLYNRGLSNLIEDLRTKINQQAKVNLITSNPDMVIIHRDLAFKLFDFIGKIDRVDVALLEKISGLYEQIIGKCDFSDIVGYISVKFSLRPDRRLQIPHEGSLMKALYRHLQTRKWAINPAGLKYYAMSAQLSKADRNALKTVATHSITTVQSLPEAAVDNIFEIDSLDQARTAFETIL